VLWRSLDGIVPAVTGAAGLVGVNAAVRSEESYPPWYRVVIRRGAREVLTPDGVRIWGDPRWAPTGELAVAAFDGIRRGIVLVDVGDGSVRWWARPAAGSYRLLALGADAGDAVAVRADADGAVWRVRARPSGDDERLDRVRARPGGDDERLELLRAADDVAVSVVRWSHDGVALEGLLACPAGEGPFPLLVFLHGGPVAGLACGEHPDLSAWVAAGLAVFMPDFRSSGIGGRELMREAFAREGLPDDDPEAGEVLTGVDALVERGVADPGALYLLGHSYGGYLAGRIIGRDHRFRAAVLCEAAGDLRLLDPVSRRMQAGWLGGDAEQVPGRWDAASPVRYAGHVRTPVLLLYAGDRSLTGQGQAWRRALAAAGVEYKLVLVRGADHVFSSGAAQEQLGQAVIEWCRRYR